MKAAKAKAPSSPDKSSGDGKKKDKTNGAQKSRQDPAGVARRAVFVFFAVAIAVLSLQSGPVQTIIRQIRGPTAEELMQERHERWLEHIAPQFPFIVGEVPRIEITPDVEFTERVAAAGQPMIISNSASTKWHASKHWNPEYMAANIPEFKNVQQHTNKTFFYYHSRPMESIPFVKENYKATVATKHNMSSVEFFRQILRPPPYNEFFYFSGDTDLLGDVMHDLYPIEPLMLKGPDFKLEESYKHRWTHVWIGPSGATSHLHYDIFHNFYAQIYGYKRFVLMAPEEIENVYIYPILHPAGQSSQVDVENPDFVKYPKFKNVKAYEAILGPGDVLYVPPLWLHHVTALDVSMSISVWSKSPETKAMWEVERQPIPVKRVWSDEKKLLGARLYLEAVVDGVLGEGSAKNFVSELLSQRYNRLMSEVPPLNPQDQSYCVETLAVPDEEEFRKEYAQGAKLIMDEVLPRFKMITSEPVKRAWLGNLCEMIAFGATDAAHAGIFLQDFVNC